ncbi:MAG: hypothetical protein AAF745_18960, partial [Planctomycetota bacterium]
PEAPADTNIRRTVLLSRSTTLRPVRPTRLDAVRTAATFSYRELHQQDKHPRGRLGVPPHPRPNPISPLARTARTIR